NNRLQPCRISVKSSGTAPGACNDTMNIGNVLDVQYSFNSSGANNGNVASITNNRDTTRSQTFAYDPLNRISTAAASTYSASPTHCWGEGFVYDLAEGPSPWGNLIQINSAGSSYNNCSQESLSIMVNSNNQISASGFTYDSAGNMTSNGIISPYFD